MKSIERVTRKRMIMKNKISKLLPSKKADEPVKPLVNATVEDHRERVLETGRKFKYPIQYSKHKMLINAIIVGVVVLGLFTLFSWFMLYKQQTVSDFYYTATRAIPIPVAEVDGESVRYGDYMRRLRASIYYLEKQENRVLGGEDGQRELIYTRRFNMNEAQRVAFAQKIAREHKLSVSDEEIDANVQTTLHSGSGAKISEKAYETSLWRYYGWSMSDYRQIVRDSLLMRKASFAIDKSAESRIKDIKGQLDRGADFATLARQVSEDASTKDNGGDVGAVNITDLDPDGLVAKAKSMSVGQVSSSIQGVDAWYIIILTDKNDNTVRYSLIKIGLSEFNKQFDVMRKDGKIREFIEIDAK